MFEYCDVFDYSDIFDNSDIFLNNYDIFEIHILFFFF